MSQLNQNLVLNNNRYRLYREHKYIFYVFSDLLQQVAKMDFCKEGSLVQLKDKIIKLESLLNAHAEYEETRIHRILKNHNSLLFEEAENQHHDQKLFFKNLNHKIEILDNLKGNTLNFKGYDFYLDLRSFFGENLAHFDYEERIIMPELQRLLTDDEIREIDQISYRQMLPEQMVHMMEVLFPHMNAEDRFTFVDDIKNCDPKKFEIAWCGISSFFAEEERSNLIEILNISDLVGNLIESKNLYYSWEKKPEGESVLMSEFHKK